TPLNHWLKWSVDRLFSGGAPMVSLLARRRLAVIAFFSTIALAFFAHDVPFAQAHVKWFSKFDYATPPQTIPQVLTPVFWAMLGLSMVVLIVLVWVDGRISNLEPVQRMSRWFEAQSDSSLLVMRVALFATLLVSWQLGTLFAPELKTNSPWIERLQ